MILATFKTGTDQRLKKIEKKLYNIYGISLPKDRRSSDLAKIKESTRSNIVHLKVKKGLSSNDSELSKQLLIYEGINLLIDEKQRLNEFIDNESDVESLSGPYKRIITWLSDFVIGNIELGDTLSEAVNEAMKEYRSSQYRYPDVRVEEDLRNELRNRMYDIETDYELSETKVNEMKQNYVQKLRMLIESEVEEAEVLIAAKGFGQEIQQMIEKVGQLANEDLGPVIDQMREVYGAEVSSSFNEMMLGDFDQLMSTLRQTKDSIDSSLQSISKGAPPGNMNDMEGYGGEQPAAGPGFVEPGFGGEAAGDGAENLVPGGGEFSDDELQAAKDELGVGDEELGGLGREEK